MVNPKHVELLRQGVATWNEWINSKGTNFIADLNEVRLREFDVREAKLSGANLSSAYLSGVVFRVAKQEPLNSLPNSLV